MQNKSLLGILDWMRKNIAIILTVLTLVLTMGASNSYPVDISKLTRDILIVDERLPKEQSVVLVLRPAIRITSYNGTPVDWKTPSEAASSRKAIYLPPGRIRLTITFTPDAVLLYSGDYPRAYYEMLKNMFFDRTFSAGEHYLLKQWGDGVNPAVLLEDLNKKRKPLEEEYYVFPRPARTVLEPNVRTVRKPPETSAGTATVVFGTGFRVFDYNGTDVYDEWYPKSKARTGHRHLWQPNRIAVPAGGTTIAFDYGFFGGRNIELSYSFEAGKEYTLAVFYQYYNADSPRKSGLYMGLWNKADKRGKAGRLDDSLIKAWRLSEEY
ncbi:hypothetical protein AGMMS50230_19170 [Spirochaetia bacterium]|nr:hypothetical protein AGMMS50230_19120 [Spirochaetia bacterium]GHV86309.1 hypothetical protein AGMMS50230_19170 [Spirochaetia bacterium]